MNAPAPLTRSALRRLRAQDMVLRHTSLAAASMAIPIPLLDMATALSIQIRMAKKLCALYHAPFELATARPIISGMLGGMSLGSLGTAGLRYLSYASYFAGTLPSAALSAAYTYALGELLLARLAAHGRIDLPTPDEAAHTIPVNSAMAARLSG